MTNATPVASPTRRPPLPLGELGEYVDRQIAKLQRLQLARNAPARAILAQLRRAANKPPGSVPNVWEFTLGGIPMPRGYEGDEPAPAEHGAHIAMTLYAFHQQSRGTGMHQRGVGLGTALRRLTKGQDNDIAVTRRFQALGTAQDLDEIVFHARGLISQLRAASLPIDYGLLADQLVMVQDPRRIDAVRLRWGRDFHRAWEFEAATETETDLSNGDKS